MKNLVKLSILALTILCLFVGCRDDDRASGGAGVSTSSSDSSSNSVAVPEPATLVLLGSGLISLAALRKKVKK